MAGTKMSKRRKRCCPYCYRWQEAYYLVLCVFASGKDMTLAGWMTVCNLTETTPRLWFMRRGHLRVSSKQALCLIPLCSSSFWYSAGPHQTSGQCCWGITDGKNAGGALGSCPRQAGDLWIFHSQLPRASFAQVQMHVASVFDYIRFNTSNRIHWTKP